MSARAKASRFSQIMLKIPAAQQNITVGAAAVSGSEGAGGLYGHYGFTSDTIIDLTNAAYQTSAAVSGNYCGGLYGVLETSGGLTITSGNTAKTYSTMKAGIPAGE